jgi:hypothetical protein
MLSASEFMAEFAVHGLLTSATWTPSGGMATAVNGAFKAPFLETLDMDATGPVFEVAAADVPGVARGDALVADGKTFRVISPKPDGKGFVRLTLQEQ